MTLQCSASSLAVEGCAASLSRTPVLAAVVGVHPWSGPTMASRIGKGAAPAKMPAHSKGVVGVMPYRIEGDASVRADGPSGSSSLCASAHGFGMVPALSQPCPVHGPVRLGLVPGAIRPIRCYACRLMGAPVKGQRILVAMSGGVIAARCRCSLAGTGLWLIGVTLHLWDAEGESKVGRCCAPEDREDARRVCEVLGIAHYVFDEREAFRNEVINPSLRPISPVRRRVLVWSAIAL